MTTAANSPAAEESAPRQKMLAAAIDLMSREGSSDWTLRRVAEALGTSHRMVIYHFGSLEGLLVAVVQAVEEQQRDRCDRLAVEYDPGEAARAFWRELADPATAAHERLFFELYAAGLQGRPYAKSLPRMSIDLWLPRLTAAFQAATGEVESAEIDARLGLAVVRGLLLDLLATGDSVAVAAAYERYLRMYARLDPTDSH